MTLIKKFAWYGSSVAFATVLALALLVTGPARTAEAAAPTAVGFTAPVQAAGLTETWVAAFTATGAGALVAGNTVTITFPSGFVIPAAPTCTATGAFAATAATCSTTGQVVTATLGTGATLANSAAGSITIVGIKNPTTAGAQALAGFTIQTTADNTNASPAADVQIWNVGITKSPTTSVPADGASTVGLTITASNGTAAGNTGSGAAQIITIETDLGTFTAAPAGAGTIATGAGTLVTGSKSATMDVQAAVISTTGETITLKAPSQATAGTATVTVKVTPATGGAAVLIGITTVSFSAPAAVPGAVASGSVTTPTGALGVSATGTATVTATFVDANGAAPIPGATLTVSTNLGVLSAPTNGTCTNQSCAGTVPTTGVFSVTLTGGGVAGSGTVTFAVGAVTATKAFTVSGSVDTLAVKIQSDIDGAGAGTTFVDAATPNATTFTVAGTNSGGRLSVTAKDTAGNRVPGAAVTAVFSPATCGAAPAVTTAGTAAADVILAITSASLTATAGTTCTVTVTSGTKTATTTFTVGGTFSATTSTMTVNAVDMDAVATQTVTVTVKDSSGNLVGDGVSVTLVVSAGAVAAPTATTVNGNATFTYVSPGTAQSVNLTAVSGALTASKAISVGGAVVTPPPAGGPGTFAAAPSFGTGNVGSAVFQGGTIEQLITAVVAAGGTSVWVQDSNGIWRSYNTLATGSAAFVNNGFNTAFAAGFGVQAVFVVR